MENAAPAILKTMARFFSWEEGRRKGKRVMRKRRERRMGRGFYSIFEGGDPSVLPRRLLVPI